MSERRFDVVSVIGLGYTGLPTAAFIAASGIRVTGVDTDAAKVEQISRGELPFAEPELDSLLAEMVNCGLLTAQQETPHADAYIIAVPTPFDANYEIDMRYILEAADKISDQLRGGELIVLESTSPPGTTNHLANFVLEQRPDLTIEKNQKNSIYFAHAPERVLPGSVMLEMENNARIIGGINERSGQLTKQLYTSFSKGELIVTDSKTAEMVKLTENTYRDINIAFANELSIISEDLEIDVWEVIRLANHHPRVNILEPGPGVGGHCIAVDPWFIVSASPQHANLIRTARKTNDSKPHFIVQKALAAVEHISRPAIACLGLAFKANVGDTRQSPAVTITAAVAEARPDASIHAVDPYLSELPPELIHHKNISLNNLSHAVERADLVLLLVDHTQFQNLTAQSFATSNLIDTRGILQKHRSFPLA